MAAKIIIDRKVKKGKEVEFFDQLKELRSKVIPSQGYIPDETLRALCDPHHYLVFSTWQSVNDWKAWEKNSERKKIQTKIEKIMMRPPKTEICVHV